MIQSKCFHKNPCRCFSQRRELLAWLKLKHWKKKIKTQKIYKSLCSLPLSNHFCVSPWIRCPWYWDVWPLLWWLPLKAPEHPAAWDVPLSKLQSLKDGLCHRSCTSKRTKQLRVPAVSPGGKACKGRPQSPSESTWGPKCQRNRTGSSSWGLSAWAGQQWHRAPSDPAAAKHTAACAQICWWGHFHAPFIYWAVSDPPVRLSIPCLLLMLLSLSLLSWFILSYTHIYNQTTQQVGSILVT